MVRIHAPCRGDLVDGVGPQGSTPFERKDPVEYMSKPDGCPGKITSCDVCQDCTIRDECLTKTQEELMIASAAFVREHLGRAEKYKQEDEERKKNPPPSSVVPAALAFASFNPMQFDDENTLIRFGCFYRTFCALTGTAEASDASVNLLKLYFDHAFAFQGAGGMRPDSERLP